MKDGTFKIPFYWRELMVDLSDAEVGKIFECVFRFSMTGKVIFPSTGLSTSAAAILDRCIADIKYQKQHPHAYRVPDSSKEIRNSQEYREWRAAVYERDHYTCQNCGQVGGTLNAHHIKSFARHPELRLDVNNGITLCKRCHKLAHDRGFKYAE